MEKEQLKILGQKNFEKYEQAYKIIDFLNKSLKSKKIIFGLTSQDSQMILTIYEE